MKDILPVIESVFGKINPVYLAIGAVVLAALAVGYKKLKPWLAKRAAAPAGAPKVVAPPSMPSDLLSKVWSSFLKELPPLFRRSIFNFQSFIVFGAAGSGKSRLIETYTDWRRQSRQFLGSKLDDPNIQIYLGSRALVFEVSATILQDASSGARKALENLFRPLMRRRTPIVVVPIDVVGLHTAGPDDVRALAETIRGRIGLLSWIDKKPIEVRIALTHLDQIEGYAEIAKLIARERLAPTVRIDLDDASFMIEAQLLERFSEFDRLLPLALKTLSSTEYTRVVHFFRDLPKYLPNLTSFISTLAAPDPLSKRPKLEQVYLTTVDGGGSNPFHAPLPAAARDPLLKHRIAALAAASAVIAYGLYGYSLENQLWGPADDAIKSFKTLPINAPTQRDRRADEGRETIMKFLQRREGFTLERLFPPFFEKPDQRMRAQFADAVRQRIILPGLEHSLTQPLPYRRSLYYLSLLYASNTNALGKLIGEEDRLNEWARVTRLKPALIRDYLTAATKPYDQPPSVDGRSLLEVLPSDVPSTASDDEAPWREFFQILTRHLEARVISPADLLELQTRAQTLLEAHEIITNFASMDPMLAGLEAATKQVFDFRDIYRQAYNEIREQTHLRQTLAGVDGLLLLIIGGDLDPIERELVLLDDFNHRMNLLLQPRVDQAQKNYTIDLRGAQFKINAQTWSEVLRNCSAREQLIAFIDNTAEPGEDLFFRAVDRFDPVELNRHTDGTAIFQGKVTIPGRYTRQAIDRNVRPSITELNALLVRMKDVSPTKSSTVALGHVFLYQAERLESLVRAGVELYAGNYVHAVDRYYSAFEIEATSKEAAQVMLKQMLRPISPFGDFLRAVHDNTALELSPDIELFEPLTAALAKYEPITKLMFEESGSRPELEAYNATLETMLFELEGQPPKEKQAAKPGDKKDEKAPEKKEPEKEEELGLTSFLDGPGKIAFARLRGDRGTARTLIVQHMSSLGLDPSMHKPFTAPADQIYLIGLEQISELVTDKWNNEIMSELRAINIYFPFTPESSEDVSPDRLARVFHPITGSVYDRWRRYIEPVVLISGTGVQKTITPMRGLRTPDRMPEIMARVRRLTDTLWDDQGNPKPLEVNISSVPFPPSADTKNYLTLVYLTNGTNALVNFNQQPAMNVVKVDWTRPTEAKLSIEITNVRNGSRSYPPRYEYKGSSWSLLHLLKIGTKAGNIRSWAFSGEETRRGEIVVQMSIENDPFELFDLGIRRPSQGDEAHSEL